MEESEKQVSISRVPLNARLYIVALKYDDAREYAYKNGYHYSRMSYIYDRNKIMGLSDITLHVLPNAYERENFNQIIQEAKIRRLQIEYV